MALTTISVPSCPPRFNRPSVVHHYLSSTGRRGQDGTPHFSSRFRQKPDPLPHPFDPSAYLVPATDVQRMTEGILLCSGHRSRIAVRPHFDESTGDGQFHHGASHIGVQQPHIAFVYIICNAVIFGHLLGGLFELSVEVEGGLLMVQVDGFGP